MEDMIGCRLAATERPGQPARRRRPVADPDNIVQIHALHPAVVRAHLSFYRELMNQPGRLAC